MTRWQAEPDQEVDPLLPETEQLVEAREVMLAPGRDLSPAGKVTDRASVARARRGTLVRWGLIVAGSSDAPGRASVAASGSGPTGPKGGRTQRPGGGEGPEPGPARPRGPG